MRMTKKRIRHFDEVLKVFSFGALQDFMNVLIILEENGLTVNDLKRYVTKKRAMRQGAYKAMKKIEAIRARQLEQHSPKCPECGRTMTLYGVNTGKMDRVPGPWKSQWYCANCGESLFLAKSPQQVVKDMKLISDEEIEKRMGRYS